MKSWDVMSVKDPSDFVCAENTTRSRVVGDKALWALGELWY